MKEAAHDISTVGHFEPLTQWDTYIEVLNNYIYCIYFTDDLVSKLSSVTNEQKASRFMDEVRA